MLPLLYTVITCSSSFDISFSIHFRGDAILISWSHCEVNLALVSLLDLLYFVVTGQEPNLCCYLGFLDRNDVSIFNCLFFGTAMPLPSLLVGTKFTNSCSYKDVLGPFTFLVEVSSTPDGTSFPAVGT